MPPKNKQIDSLKPAKPAASAVPLSPLPAEDTTTALPPSSPSSTPKASLEPKPSSGETPARRPWYRRRWFYIAAAVLMIAAGGGLLAYKLMAKKPVAVVAPATPKATPTPTPTLLYSPLTGLPVASAAAQTEAVIGVMIENLYPDARPQSGLGEAGIVYEALAEGGITRFLAIFQEPLPPTIGPVRSLRPYYLDWGLEHNIPIVHAGGSQPALAEIIPLGLKDINALRYDGSYFFRTKDRVAPHNLYTNAQLLSQLDSKLGFATAPTFAPLARKADAPEASPTHPVITINFSTSPYAVKYTYNPKTNGYGRDDGGTAHIDRLTGTQIQVKNVVVEFVPTTYGTQDDGKPETNYSLIGSGRALVFEDGGVTAATWSKTTDPAPTTLVDSAGRPISFNRGNTWYEVVQTTTSITY